MIRWLAFLLALGIVLATGYAHGTLSGRWGSSAVLDDAVARVALVPRVIGAWTARDLTPDEAAFAQAGAQSYWIRLYTHAKTRASVQVILMCGRAGRMAMHTPEVCYPGSGYQMAGAAQPFAVAPGATFWTARFTKDTSLESGAVRLFWAWNADGSWQAPTSPRWDFGGRPFLYKLYVSHELTGIPLPFDSDAALQFLRDSLPELQLVLYPEEQRK